MEVERLVKEEGVQVDGLVDTLGLEVAGNSRWEHKEEGVLGIVAGNRGRREKRSGAAAGIRIRLLRGGRFGWWTR